MYGLVRSFSRNHVRVQGKHVFITGGSEGLGLAFAELMVAEGAHVTVVARNQGKLDAAKAVIQGKRANNKSQKVQVFSCDVTQSEQLNRVVEEAIKGAGPIDMLVANAGISIPKLFHDQTVEEIKQMMDVNYLGSVNAVHSVLKGMRDRRAGKIVLVGSGMCLTAFAGYAGYCGSKWALRGFAEALATETSRYGVSVHVYYAPTMNTPGLAAENLVKPEVTRKLEDIGSPVSAEEAAVFLSRGIARGSFGIAGDPGLELLALGSLASPTDHLALRILVSPLVAILAAGWRSFIGFMVKNHVR